MASDGGDDAGPVRLAVSSDSSARMGVSAPAGSGAAAGGVKGAYIGAPIRTAAAAANDEAALAVAAANAASAPWRASPDAFAEYFEIAETARFIVANRAKRVALQFHDAQLPDSGRVVAMLRYALRAADATAAGVATGAAAGTAAGATAAVATSTADDVQLYILADTAYSACCVDEVAAQHADAQLIVHYGHACLSPTRRVPVRYCFGRRTVDVVHCARTIAGSEELKAALQPGGAGVVVLYDLEYAHAMPALRAALAATTASGAGAAALNVSVASVEREYVPSTPAPAAGGAAATASDAKTAAPAAAAAAAAAKPVAGASTGTAAVASAAAVPVPTGCVARTFCGYAFHTPAPAKAAADDDDADAAAAARFVIVFVGAEGPALTNVLLNFNSHSTYTYTPRDEAVAPAAPAAPPAAASAAKAATAKAAAGPVVLRKEDAKVNRTLSRRYFLMEKAKNAQIIGIVVGTLGVANFVDVIAHLKQRIRAADKKYYLFVVGKINAPKLANFSEIDIFVVVSCPLTSLLDTTGFFKDVVTPFELDLALDADKEWTGAYSTDFRQLLSPDALTASATRKTEKSEDELAGVRYSSVSRTLVPIAGVDHAPDVTTAPPPSAAAAAAAGGVLVPVTGSTALTVTGAGGSRPANASEYMLTRTFKGLDLAVTTDEAARITPGWTGIPRNYDEQARYNHVAEAGAVGVGVGVGAAGGAAGAAAAAAAASGAATAPAAANAATTAAASKPQHS